MTTTTTWGITTSDDDCPISRVLFEHNSHYTTCGSKKTVQSQTNPGGCDKTTFKEDERQRDFTAVVEGCHRLLTPQFSRDDDDDDNDDTVIHFLGYSDRGDEGWRERERERMKGKKR